MSTISKPALKRLQTLCSQASHRLFEGTAAEQREQRLAWATQLVGRPVESFSALTSSDGKLLIDAIQRSLGLAETTPSKRQRRTTADRQKLGTEGRRDQVHAQATMLDGSEEVFSKIQRAMTDLGWDQQRLVAFLRSPSCPNNGRDRILTLGDANHVYWALKRMATRSHTFTRRRDPHVEVHS